MTTWLRQNLKGDYQIWTIVALLSLISVVVVFSATGRYAITSGSGTLSFLFKHSSLVIAALIAMWSFHRIDYHYFSRISGFGVLVSIVLLIYTYKFGVSINDARRWVRLPLIGMTFMPSDLAKLSLITNLAGMLARRQHLAKAEYKFTELLPMVLKIVIVCACISLTNVSTAVLLFATCFLLMFFGRVPTQYLVMSVMGIIFAAIILVMTGTGSRIETARNRINNYISGIKGTKKKDAAKDEDYQIERSFYAIANGAGLGKGPGKSQQRYFLSQADSDFVYAIIIEEWGPLGGITVLGLYLWFLYRGMKAVDSSGRAFGGLLSAGLTFSLVIQALVNMGVATGLGPVTGQPLPLLSMGGSSLIFTGITVGIIISVSRDKVKDSVLK
ncbi:cell division protein FtsW [Pseudarcicella hirudinis]|uniref:Probable peptidoglycan glycosyltransferase FtsW n=1 Tax=Pseudarcicella hirudinis TaxID=1079859 RepID=A0A1I5UGS3_9BACT|nr:FtsW/RodA/SpoVE family cell cycle protein [Pseudarcicella hirudinis]SFP94475.1 cell division protein FtsW [Pseudarcicella hirudinis]